MSEIKIGQGRTIKPAAWICGWLFLATLYGCAGSQAAYQIREGRRALLTGKPEVAVQYFEQAAALDSKYIGSPLQGSAWTYVGRGYYAAMKYSLARQALERALAQNQDDPMARIYLGLISTREQASESSRAQVQAGLQGLYDRIEYIKYYTFAGEFWDVSGQLGAELRALIKTVSAPPVDWSSAIPRIESLGLKVENEIDRAQREDANRYHSGGSGGGDM